MKFTFEQSKSLGWFACSEEIYLIITIFICYLFKVEKIRRNQLKGIITVSIT